MTVRFTKKQSENGIQLTRNCQIGNFDPKKDTNKNNKLIFDFNAKTNGSCSIGKVQEKLLWALTGGHIGYGCDDPDDLFTLTEQDLNEAHTRFLDKDRHLFGDIKVKEFRYDEYYGIANITTDKGDVLRVDLLTDAERRDGVDSSKGIFKKSDAHVVKTIKKVPDKKTQVVTQTPKKTEVAPSNNQNDNVIMGILSKLVDNFRTKKPENTNHVVDNSKTAELPELYKEKLKQIARSMGISQSQLNQEIKQTAESTGFSEYFITHIISLEHFEPTVKQKQDGTLTAGFGHSTLRDRTLYQKKNQAVSARQAFSWLTSDIKYFTNVVKGLKLGAGTDETFGDYWDRLPLSIREAMIDVAFNRDARKLQNAEEYVHLRANIRNGEENLPASAMRLRQDFSHYSHEQKLNNTHTTGLMERNCYRFLLAIRDFDSEYRASAKRRFENEDSYYTETLQLKHQKGLDGDVRLLKDAWNKMS